MTLHAGGLTAEVCSPGSSRAGAPHAAWVVGSYLDDLAVAVETVDRRSLTALVGHVQDTLTSGGRLFIAGNGGSGSSAIHMASDWTEACSRLRSRPLILALNENIARITAIANDHGFEHVFARQITERGRSGDLLVLLSVSGDSPNLVRAAEGARGLGMTVAAVLGRRGHVAGLADLVVVLGKGDYGLSEDLHLAITHMVVRLLHGGRARTFAGPETGY